LLNLRKELDAVARMTIEQDALHAQIRGALEQADLIGDHLIAALLSQCIALLEDRDRPRH